MRSVSDRESWPLEDVVVGYVRYGKIHIPFRYLCPLISQETAVPASRVVPRQVADVKPGGADKRVDVRAFSVSRQDISRCDVVDSARM